MHLEHQRRIRSADDNPGAIEFELVAGDQLARCPEIVAVYFERRSDTDRLHKGLAVQLIQQRNRTASRTGQPQLAIGSRAYSQWQAGDRQAAVAFAVANDDGPWRSRRENRRA